MILCVDSDTGNELDEIKAHKLLECFGITKTHLDLRNLLKTIDIDKNGKVSLVELLVMQFKVDWKELVLSIDEQGDGGISLKETSDKLKQCQESMKANAEASKKAREELQAAKKAEKEAKEQKEKAVEAERIAKETEESAKKSEAKAIEDEKAAKEAEAKQVASFNEAKAAEDVAVAAETEAKGKPTAVTRLCVC